MPRLRGGEGGPKACHKTSRIIVVPDVHKKEAGAKSSHTCMTISSVSTDGFIFYFRMHSYQEFVSFFSIPFTLCALFLSLPPINSRNSDPGSHGRLSSPAPSTVRAFDISIARRLHSALASLVHSRLTGTPQLSVLFSVDHWQIHIVYLDASMS